VGGRCGCTVLAFDMPNSPTDRQTDRQTGTVADTKTIHYKIYIL